MYIYIVYFLSSFLLNYAYSKLRIKITFLVYRRVHISDATLSFLDGEFEVEPGYGEKRDEALRIAGLKTYFIVKVLKPVSKYYLYCKKKETIIRLTKFSC